MASSAAKDSLTKDTVVLKIEYRIIQLETVISEVLHEGDIAK